MVNETAANAGGAPPLKAKSRQRPITSDAGTFSVSVRERKRQPDHRANAHIRAKDAVTERRAEPAAEKDDQVAIAVALS